MSKKKGALRPTDNGRSTLESLKKEYDKVVIKHSKNEDGSGRTTVLLVSGRDVYVGVAKFSNRGDTYSRTHGRLIAQGRAELAAAVSLGDEQERQSSTKRREELSYTLTADTNNSVENIIDLFLK